MSDLSPEDEGWRQLADVDNSEAYSIDRAEVWVTPTGTYVWRSASGCSCWDGEYSEQEFDNLALLALALFREEAQYQPSLKDALDLLRQVFKSEDAQ